MEKNNQKRKLQEKEVSRLLDLVNYRADRRPSGSLQLEQRRQSGPDYRHPQETPSHPKQEIDGNTIAQDNSSSANKELKPGADSVDPLVQHRRPSRQGDKRLPETPLSPKQKIEDLCESTITQGNSCSVGKDLKLKEGAPSKAQQTDVDVIDRNSNIATFQDDETCDVNATISKKPEEEVPDLDNFLKSSLNDANVEEASAIFVPRRLCVISSDGVPQPYAQMPTADCKIHLTTPLVKQLDVDCNDFDLTVSESFNDTEITFLDEDDDCEKTKSFVSGRVNLGFEEDHRVIESRVAREKFLLPFKDYEDWFETLRTNDVTAYSRTMRNSDIFTKRRLANGNFRYNISDALNAVKSNSSLWVETPLAVAAVFGSKELFLDLIRDGAYVHKRDLDGYNIVHVLIAAAHECPKSESRYMDIYRCLMQNIPRDDCRRLLLGECAGGFRPVEFAAKRCTFGLFRLILETPSVYEKLLGKSGLQAYYAYNVVEYENFRDWYRETKSPLRFLSDMDQTCRQRCCQYLYDFPATEKWIERKFRRNLPFIFAWFSLRLIYLTIVVCVDPGVMHKSLRTCATGSAAHPICNTSGQTGLTVSSDLLMLIGFISLFMVLFDVAEFSIFLYDEKRPKKLQKSYFRSPFFFYRMSQLAVELLTLCSTMYSFNTDELVINKMRTIKAISLPFLVASFMYMMEVIPVIGTFVILLQRILVLLIKSFVIFLPVGFVFTFFLFTSFPVGQANQSGFDSFSGAALSTFQLSIGGSVLESRQEIYIKLARYILAFLTLAIILAFLVAVHQTIVVESMRERSFLQTMRRLAVCFAVEDRFVRWFWRLLAYFHTMPPVFTVTVVKTLRDSDGFSPPAETRWQTKDDDVKEEDEYSLEDIELVLGGCEDA